MFLGGKIKQATWYQLHFDMGSKWKLKNKRNNITHHPTGNTAFRYAYKLVKLINYTTNLSY